MNPWKQYFLGRICSRTQEQHQDRKYYSHLRIRCRKRNLRRVGTTVQESGESGVWSTKEVKKETQGFPGGPVVQNPPCNREHQLNSWSKKIPHTMQQLSPHTTAIDPMLQSLCSAPIEATTMRGPCTTTRVAPMHCTCRKAWAAMKTQYSHK